MWDELEFNFVKFIIASLPFPEDFLCNYKVVYNKLSLNLLALKENYLLMVILMERAYKENHAQNENKLKMKLISYQGDLDEGHEIIEALQKEKEVLRNI